MIEPARVTTALALLIFTIFQGAAIMARKEHAGKAYLSPSQLEMICRCGESYRRRYIEKEICPPGIDQARGTAVHEVASVNFRQKITSGRDLRADDARMVAAESFDAQIAGGVSVGPDVGNVDVAIGATRDLVVDMAYVHITQQAPDYERPVLVEAEFRIELPGPYDALGIIDLADDQKRVTDFKTSKRSKSQADADSSVQLTMYSCGHQQLTGEPAAECRLDTVVATKTKIGRQVVTTERGPADYSALAARMNVVASAIAAGTFLPVDTGSWVCHPRYCGYWHDCVFVQGQRERIARMNNDE